MGGYDTHESDSQDGGDANEEDDSGQDDASHDASSDSGDGADDGKADDGNSTPDGDADESEDSGRDDSSHPDADPSPDTSPDEGPDGEVDEWVDAANDPDTGVDPGTDTGSDSGHEPDEADNGDSPDTDPDVVDEPDGDNPTDECDADELLDSVRDYNVFVYGDYIGGHSDAEGRIAAGGDITLWSYSVGLLTPGGTTTVAGGSVNAWNASFHGDITAGSEINLTNSDQDLPGGGSGVLRFGESLDFESIHENLELASQQLDELPTNGHTSVTAWHAIELSGSSNTVNVFEVEGSALARAVSLEINVPASSAVVVNISGTTTRFSNFGVFSDVGPGQLLFNAPNCRSVEISAFGFVGSLLAPHAAVDFDNGQFNGSLFAYELLGDGLDDSLPDGQFNHDPLETGLCPHE